MLMPIALDLFCCAGGASEGLRRAGYEVVGVDIVFKGRYPFRFHHADALAFPLDGYDFIWASPPCQGYTAMRHAPGAKGAPLLIDAIRERLQQTGVPWCIENVEEAAWAMRDPITLCGSMFGLGAQGCRTQRHRLFECNGFQVVQPSCRLVLLWLAPVRQAHAVTGQTANRIITTMILLMVAGLIAGALFLSFRGYEHVTHRPDLDLEARQDGHVHDARKG